MALAKEGWPWDSLLHPAGHSNCQEETALSAWLSKGRQAAQLGKVSDILHHQQWVSPGRAGERQVVLIHLWARLLVVQAAP